MAVSGLATATAVGAVAPYLLGAGVSFVLGRRGAQVIVVAVCLLALVSALVLLAEVMQSGTVTVPLGGWSAPLGIQWRADGLSAVMLVATSAVGLAVAVHAGRYFDAEGEPLLTERFQPLLMFLLASLSALFLSGDMFNLYVTLELSGLASIALVALEGTTRVMQAALRYLFVTLASATAFLMGVALLYGTGGVLDLRMAAERLDHDPAVGLAMILMTVGLMGKGALFPLHGWLPPAHGSAPPPASALLSGLVVKSAFYVLLRLWIEVFGPIDAGEVLRQALGVMGAGAILWGGVQALRQRRLKLVLAYSTVAQLGYLLLAFPLLGAEEPWRSMAFGGFGVLMVSHALAKSAMFLSAGLVIAAVGHDRIPAVTDAVQVRPMTVFTFGAGGLTLAGLPPGGGFVGKWNLLQGSLGSGQWWWAVVLLAGSLLAMGYVLRILAPAMRRREAVPERRYKRVPKSLELAALMLALGSVALGIGGASFGAVVQDALAGAGGAP